MPGPGTGGAMALAAHPHLPCTGRYKKIARPKTKNARSAGDVGIHLDPRQPNHERNHLCE
jgi:hypothetical protein